VQRLVGEGRERGVGAEEADAEREAHLGGQRRELERAAQRAEHEASRDVDEERRDGERGLEPRVHGDRDRVAGDGAEEAAGADDEQRAQRQAGRADASRSTLR
jgi:hypothetical protein